MRKHFLPALCALLLCLAPLCRAEASPVLIEDAQEGRWLYESASVRVEIVRREDAEKKLVWYESDLRFSSGMPLKSFLTPGAKPGRAYWLPDKIAQEYGLIFAVTDDFFRARTGDSSITDGIVIRNGAILAEKTFKSGRWAFPPLETAALFPDGSLSVHESAELTADEYLALGAIDVLSFGPILVRDGEKGAYILNEKYPHNGYREPRCAIGMIEPGHLIILTVDGRSKNSKGATLVWLADKMLELGATQALNLDGGNTVALMFNGKKINTTSNATKAIRKVTSVLGIAGE